MNRRDLARLSLIAGLGLVAAGCAPTTPLQTARPVTRPVCDTSFRVVNSSAVVVQQLFFGSSMQRAWGADQLGQDVLSPGQAKAYRASYSGNYDFRVVWANGRTADLMAVNICAVNQITVTNGGLRAS